MFPNREIRQALALRKQRGSMLVIAIVVMTVVLLLGLAITRVLSSSTDTIVYEVLGFRALNAARSGIEINLSTALSSGANLNAICSTPQATPIPLLSAPSFSVIPGLESCRYTASCVIQPFNGIDGVTNYLRFESTGECNTGDVVVSRTVAVDARI